MNEWGGSTEYGEAMEGTGAEMDEGSSVEMDVRSSAEIGGETDRACGCGTGGVSEFTWAGEEMEVPDSGAENGFRNGRGESGFRDWENTEQASGREVCGTEEFSLSQVLMTPELAGQQALERQYEAQSRLEQMQRESVATILEKYGSLLDEEAQTRLKEGTNVYAVENMGRNVAGVHTLDASHPNPSVQVAVNSDTRMRCTDLHENMHNASWHSQTVEFDRAAGRYHVERVVGSHEVSYDVDTEGNILNMKQSGRAITESITHARTLECLSEEEARFADAHSGYREAAGLSRELEGIIGRQAVDESYFQGKDTMRETMEALQPGAYERYSYDLEQLTYSRSAEERAFASIDCRHLLEELREERQTKSGQADTTGGECPPAR